MLDHQNGRAAVVDALSRQIAHDFSNFVHNLVLQIEIWENSPQPPQANWQSLRQECSRMARLLQQWDRYHARASSTEPGRFDLNEAVGAVAREASVSVGPAVSAGPLWIQGSPSGLQQLLWLLIEESLQACALAECSANLALETQPADNGAIVRLTATGDFQPLQEEPDRVSLVGATCRSFAARLDVRISQEQCDQTRRVMVLELSNEEK